MRQINFRLLFAGVGTAVIVGTSAFSAPALAAPANTEPTGTHIGGYTEFLEPIEDGPAPDFYRNGEVNIFVSEHNCTSERSRKLAGVGVKDSLVFAGLVIDCKNGKPTYRGGWKNVDGKLNYHEFEVAPGEMLSAELRELDPESGNDYRMQKWAKKADGTWEAVNYYREHIYIGLAGKTVQFGVFQDKYKLTPGKVTFYNITINEDKRPGADELDRVPNTDTSTTSDMYQNPEEPTWNNVFDVVTK